MPRYTVVGFYSATASADIERRSAEDAEAATRAHIAERVRTDGGPIPDWFYVATLEAPIRPVLASFGAAGIGPAAPVDAGGEGARYLVLGLLVSTAAARIVSLRRLRAFDAVEAAMADPVGDFQFVCAFNARGDPLYTVENVEDRR